jgi:similar to stage IV sporulation protein
VPPIIPGNVPCNVVAAKAGVITNMNVLKGSAQTTVGQTVKKGQLLVSGIVDSEKVGARFVHAMAEVTARTWYTMYGVMPLQCKYKAYTGETKTRRSLIFGGIRVNLYFDTSKPLVTCDKIIKKTQLSISKDIPLPVMLVTEEYFAYNSEPFALPAEEAVQMILKSLDAAAKLAADGGNIVEKRSETLSKQGLASIRLYCEAEEHIAKVSQIPASAYAGVQQ